MVKLYAGPIDSFSQFVPILFDPKLNFFKSSIINKLYYPQTKSFHSLLYTAKTLYSAVHRRRIFVVFGVFYYNIADAIYAVVRYLPYYTISNFFIVYKIYDGRDPITQYAHTHIYIYPSSLCMCVLYRVTISKKFNSKNFVQKPGPFPDMTFSISGPKFRTSNSIQKLY